MQMTTERQIVTYSLFTCFPLRLQFSFNTNKYKQFEFLIVKYGDNTRENYFIQICIFYAKIEVSSES